MQGACSHCSTPFNHLEKEREGDVKEKLTTSDTQYEAAMTLHVTNPQTTTAEQKAGLHPLSSQVYPCMCYVDPQHLYGVEQIANKISPIK